MPKMRTPSDTNKLKLRFEMGPDGKMRLTVSVVDFPESTSVLVTTIVGMGARLVLLHLQQNVKDWQETDGGWERIWTKAGIREFLAHQLLSGGDPSVNSHYAVSLLHVL